MLDLEFLLNRPNHRGPVIYFYREGVLRERVLAALRTDGRLVFSANALEMTHGGGLFDGVPYCDLGSEPAFTRKSQIAKAVIEFGGSGVTAGILFAPLTADEINLDVGTSDYLHLEEKSVNVESVASALRYAAQTSDLAIGLDIAEQETCRSYFAKLVSESGPFSYSEFFEEFDRGILLFVDEATRQFTGTLADEDLRKRALIARPLRHLVVERDAQALIRLLEAFALKYPGRSEPALTEVVEQTLRLIMVHAGQPSDVHTVAAIAIWTAVLLCELDEPTSVTRTTAMTIDRIARKFLARSDPTRRSSALVGLWPHLSSPAQGVYDRDALYAAGADMLSRVQPASFRWMRRLELAFRRNYEKPRGEAACANDAKPGSDPTLDPVAAKDSEAAKRFSELIGREGTISVLRRRFLKDAHKRPLILSGVSGVGKHAVALAYGRASICERVTANELDSCGACGSCKSFDDGLCRFLIDTGAAAGKEYFRSRLFYNIRHAPLAERHVVIVDRADEDTQLMDVCLKTIENQDRAVTFIFLVENIDRMNAACKSRCEVIHLSPLTRQESSLLVAGVLGSGNSFDSMIPLLVSLMSNGLPREVRSLSEALVHANAFEIPSAAKVLNLDWGVEAIAWASSLVEGSDNDRWQWPPIQIAKIRALLAAMAQRHLGSEISEPALLLRGLDLDQLVDRFQGLALRRNTTFQAIWDMLADVWSCEDLTDEVALEDASARTKALLGRI